MTFTEELYQHISSLYSGMTVRGFSKLCGKSEGYFGSMKAQNLELATSAITNLLEELEQRKMMFISMNASAKQITELRDVQLFIADEIAARHHKCSENQNIKIRHMLLEAVSNLADQELANRTPAPVFIGLN
jgi:hemoglobin-like flavoprotein